MTYRNLLGNPLASLLYVGPGPRCRSFQLDCVVDVSLYFLSSHHADLADVYFLHDFSCSLFRDEKIIPVFICFITFNLFLFNQPLT